MQFRVAHCPKFLQRTIQTLPDSGPYAIYTEAKGWGIERDVVEVPEAIYQRYDKAYSELGAAQDALDEAIEAARRSAKPKQPT